MVAAKAYIKLAVGGAIWVGLFECLYCIQAAFSRLNERHGTFVGLIVLLLSFFLVRCVKSFPVGGCRLYCFRGWCCVHPNAMNAAVKSIVHCLR
jgi:hypothetical protein